MLGHLSLPGIQGFWEGYTVERPWKNNKPHISCIQAGVYEAFTRVSPTNGKVIELKDVPGRSHIQLHIANWAWQLEGCIGPGLERKPDGVGESGAAMEDLYELCQGQEIQVEIIASTHFPDKRGDEIEPAGKVPAKEIPTVTPEMPKEWLEPVNYKKALTTFIGKLRRDIKRKQVAGVVIGLAGLTLSIRYPIIHKMRTTLGGLYNIINNDEEKTMSKIIERLKRIEKSTWAGAAVIVGVLLSFFGLNVDPEVLLKSVEGIVAGIGLIIASAGGLYEMIRRERAKKEE